jgi:hypothetical protein
VAKKFGWIFKRDQWKPQIPCAQHTSGLTEIDRKCKQNLIIPVLCGGLTRAGQLNSRPALAISCLYR